MSLGSMGSAALGRREFLRLLGVLASLAPGLPGSAVATTRTGGRSGWKLGPQLVRAIAEDRPHPAYFTLNGSSTFAGHTHRGDGYTRGGIDYAPLETPGETLVCPIANGLVTGTNDHASDAGMFISVAHGLGWKTEYAHLAARYVSYRDPVLRREAVGVMGRSGLGASRPQLNTTRPHLHVTLYGPAYLQLFHDVHVQHWSDDNPGWQLLVDAEQFSAAGPGRPLPYSRRGDARWDDTFLTQHHRAVKLCDDLLAWFPGPEAAQVKSRSRNEQETGFDWRVDERMWFLWQRLDAGRHPFGPEEAETHKRALLELMMTPPRFTAPIVEMERHQEYKAGRRGVVAGG
jgi:murein DD-endopeptidase MepM/ murein hydrolase activator NlpD